MAYLPPNPRRVGYIVPINGPLDGPLYMGSIYTNSCDFKYLIVTVPFGLLFQQKLAKREGGAIDRSQDIAKLQDFYKLYREKNKVDELIEDEMKLRESAVFSGNLGE